MQFAGDCIAPLLSFPEKIMNNPKRSKWPVIVWIIVVIIVVWFYWYLLTSFTERL